MKFIDLYEVGRQRCAIAGIPSYYTPVARMRKRGFRRSQMSQRKKRRPVKSVVLDQAKEGQVLDSMWVPADSG